MITTPTSLTPTSTPRLDDFSTFLKKFKQEEKKTEEKKTEIRRAIFTLAKEQFCQTYIRSPIDLKPPILHFPRLPEDTKVYSIVKSISNDDTIAVDSQISENIIPCGSTSWEARIQLFRNRKHTTVSESIRLKDKPLYLVINIGCFSFVSNGFFLHSNQKQVHDPENINKPQKDQQKQGGSSKVKKSGNGNISPKVLSAMCSRLETTIENFTKEILLKPYSMRVFFSEELSSQNNEITLTLLNYLGVESVGTDDQKDFVVIQDNEDQKKYSQYGVKCINVSDFLNFFKFRRL